VHPVATETLQAGLEAAPDGVAGVVERLGEVADLGGEVVWLGDAAERHPQDLFAPTAAIERGRVKVVDAEIQGPAHQSDAMFRWKQSLLRPAVEPGAAQANLADLPASFPEGAILQRMSR